MKRWVSLAARSMAEGCSWCLTIPDPYILYKFDNVPAKKGVTLTCVFVVSKLRVLEGHLELQFKLDVGIF